jgi:hypothetical protein
MEKLPTHVATADEPIPALRDHDIKAPDLRNVTPVEAMIADLGKLDENVEEYVDRFRELLDEAGIYVSLTIDRDGSQHLGAGSACNSQLRHRSRYIHFLFADLDRIDGRADELERRLWREGRCADNRPVDPGQVTNAIRDFLRTEGRILVTPSGSLTEGGEIPRLFLEGTADESAECVRASRAYFDLNLRFHARRQITRAVRMLGKPTANGWLVLEARS